MASKRKSSSAIGRRPRTRRARKPALDIEALAAEQGVKPVEDPRELIGDFWPETESVDEFLSARKRWQRDAQERKR